MSETTTEPIEHGDEIIITDAEGQEWTTTALSGVKHGHKFPVVFVNRPLVSGGFDPMPWPAEAVRRISSG